MEAQMVSDYQEVEAGLSGSVDEEARRLRGQPEDRVMDGKTDPDHSADQVAGDDALLDLGGAVGDQVGHHVAQAMLQRQLGRVAEMPWIFIEASMASFATTGGHHLLIEAIAVWGRPVARSQSAR